VKNPFAGFNKKKQPKLPVVIVSGLPRSGTSMMMKMLVEGGLQAVTDGLRQADNDNPNGYFEFEAVKEMTQGNLTWMDGANGKVVKVISSLLEYLPPQHSYKILFMERELSEVLASQQKMLTNRNETSTVEDEALKQQFQGHLKTVRAWLVRQPNIEVMYVNFNALMADPEPFCPRITEFIGLSMNIEQMLSVPNKNLYRNRS
jgi:hypothetical protein